MKITRLQPLVKIYLNAKQNYCRPFSFKFDMAPVNRSTSEHAEEATISSEEPPKPPKPPNVPFRYNMYQQRASLERPNINELQKRCARNFTEEQPSVFENLKMEDALTVNQGQSSHNKRFQVSKTCANALLPLKSVKLANPFPEPVKMMMSRTVSDYEKAEQMLADAKNQMNISNSSNKPFCSNFRSFSTGMKRWYSRSAPKESEKCKKVQSFCPNWVNYPRKTEALYGQKSKNAREIFIMNS